MAPQQRLPLAFIAILVIGRAQTARRALPIHDEPWGDSAHQANQGEQPPRGNGVALPHSPTENGADDGRADGSADAAEGGGEAVQRAEDAQGGGAVGQQNGGAREADDDDKALDEHNAEEHGVSGGGVLDEGGEGGHEVDDGENEGCGG